MFQTEFEHNPGELLVISKKVGFNNLAPHSAAERASNAQSGPYKVVLSAQHYIHILKNENTMNEQYQKNTKRMKNRS